MDNADIQRSMHGDSRWVGLVAGGVALGAVGALVGYSGYEPKITHCFTGFGGSPCSHQLNSRFEDTANAALALGGIGAGLGYLLGRTVGRWETVELDQITVGAGNVAVSMRIVR